MLYQLYKAFCLSHSAAADHQLHQYATSDECELNEIDFPVKALRLHIRQCVASDSVGALHVLLQVAAQRYETKTQLLQAHYIAAVRAAMSCGSVNCMSWLIAHQPKHVLPHLRCYFTLAAAVQACLANMHLPQFYNHLKVLALVLQHVPTSIWPAADDIKPPEGRPMKHKHSLERWNNVLRILDPLEPWSPQIHSSMPPAFKDATRALLFCSAAKPRVETVPFTDSAHAAQAAYLAQESSDVSGSKSRVFVAGEDGVHYVHVASSEGASVEGPLNTGPLERGPVWDADCRVQSRSIEGLRSAVKGPGITSTVVGATVELDGAKVDVNSCAASSSRKGGRDSGSGLERAPVERAPVGLWALPMHVVFKILGKAATPAYAWV